MCGVGPPTPYPPRPERQVLDWDQGLGIILRGELETVLDESKISGLSYEDFARDRVRLLNLGTQ